MMRCARLCIVKAREASPSTSKSTVTATSLGVRSVLAYFVRKMEMQKGHGRLCREKI